MSKGRIYTLLILSISFAVVIGGWFLTKTMLDRKEEGILAMRGEIPIDVSAFKIIEDETVVETFENVDLTENEMADILRVWDGGGREIVHEPMPGQMSMEQAINAGREWIGRLAENNILPGYLAECSFNDTSAVLCSISGSISINDNHISYWKVAYVEGDVEILLTIHALSGQIWKAYISMNEDKMLHETGSDEEIISIAFPFLENYGAITIEENSSRYATSSKGAVYVTLKRDSILVDKEEPRERLLLSLSANIE